MTDIAKMTLEQIEAEIEEIGFTLEMWPPPRPMCKWGYCLYDGIYPWHYGGRRCKTKLGTAQAALRLMRKYKVELDAIYAARAALHWLREQEGI